MSEAETGSGNQAGKAVVVGMLLLIVVGVGGIGYYHATRNRVRHEHGLGGPELYAMYCARCHGEHFEGGGAYPPLIGSELDQARFTEQVHTGRNLMPAFPELTAAECSGIYTYVHGAR